MYNHRRLLEALLASTGAAYGLASPRSGIFFRGFFAFPRVSGRFGCLQFFSSRGGPQTQNYPRTPANRKYLRVDHLTGLENFSISERKQRSILGDLIERT